MIPKVSVPMPASAASPIRTTTDIGPGEGEHDFGECVPDERGRPAEEEEAEVALSQRACAQALSPIVIRGTALSRGGVLAACGGVDIWAAAKMEPTGLEPVPYWLPANRSPN